MLPAPRADLKPNTADFERLPLVKPTGFREYSYIDARDLAVAYRLALERPIPDPTVLFIVADDSTVAEPLCELLPRLEPRIGDKARDLTGTRSVFSNERAKEVLGWRPAHTWRSSV